MEVAYLGAVFLVIVVFLLFKRPLYQAILGGLVTAAVCYHIPLKAIFSQTVKVLTEKDSVSIILSLYLITYLQQMLEDRNLLRMAQRDLNGLIYNQRINIASTLVLIGLLPSAAATLLCGDIIKETTDGYLNRKEQAFVTSWFRHIPESTLPTYASVLLMSNMAGVPLPRFMMGMLIPVLVLAMIGYYPYLCRLPKSCKEPTNEKRWKSAMHFLQHMWPLLSILALIFAFQLSVVSAVLLVIAATAIFYRFAPRKLVSMIRSAFEPNILLNTFLVLVLKETIDFTGSLQLLPQMLGQLPIPPYLIYSLLFFAGGIISGTGGIVALGTPVAFANAAGNVPLMVLLMCICHAASQISPTHVCLSVVSDYFHISIGETICKTLPRALLFCVLMIGYYNIMLLLA